MGPPLAPTTRRQRYLLNDPIDWDAMLRGGCCKASLHIGIGGGDSAGEIM